MTTRFYLTTNTAPYTPATAKGAWSDTSLMATRTYELGRTKAGTNTNIQLTKSAGTNNWKGLLHRHVSGPIVGGSIPAALSMTHTEARMESNSLANMTVQITVWVTAGDSDTNRGTLFNFFTGATEFATAMTAFSYAITADNTVVAQAGDRLVFEIGYNAATTRTADIGQVNIGGTAADLATTGTTGVATDSPWVEFAAGGDVVLAAYSPPAFLPAEPTVINQAALVRAHYW